MLYSYFQIIYFILIKLIYIVFLRFDQDSEDFFSAAVRTLVVDFILERQSFRTVSSDALGNNKSDASDAQYVGIKKLIEDGIYKAAYPLHDVRNLSTKLN